MRLRAARVLLVFVVLLCALYLPALAWPQAAVYRNVITPNVLRRIGALAQTAPLVIGAVYALRAARTLESGNRAKAAWWLLGGWLASFAIGEIILSTYRAILGIEPPSPSAGDAFFVVGYVFLVASTLWFVRVYAASGLPVGSVRGHVALGAVATVVLGALTWPVVVPLAHAQRPLLQILVSAGYPVLDAVVMVPTVLLVRMTVAFRGGRVWTAWASILLAFVVLAGADALFAYSDLVGFHALDPLVIPIFATGYALAAYGAILQYAIVAE
jgi:hypothetical protein